MLWDSPAESVSRSIGKDAKTHSAQQRIVDGQQRLTSLFAVITGKMVLNDDYDYRKIHISFNPFYERFEVANAAIRQSAEWVADISEVFKLPYMTVDPFLTQYGKAHDLTDADRQELRGKLSANFQKLFDLKKRLFNAATISSEIHPSIVADIFVRINSKGVKLNQADFILTHLSVFWNEGRERLEEFARNSHLTPDLVTERTGIMTNWTPRNHYISPDPKQLLRVIVTVGQRRGELEAAYNALRGENRDQEIDRMKNALDYALKPSNWDDFLHVLQRAGFRSKKMKFSANALLHTYSMWLIGLIDYKYDRTKLREVMARWFFMAHVTQRYTTSHESRLDNDLARLADAGRGSDAFVSFVDSEIAVALTQDFWDTRLPNSLETSSKGRSPFYQAYIAALNILDADLFLLDGKVRDWVDPNRDTIVGVQEHHLFPRDYLRKIKITENRHINQVANYAPTDAYTNNRISSRPPYEYWPDLLQDRKISGESLRLQRF